ncbi:MAG TPA: DUF3291 domain-containing protein, partial [Candidatus Synoicihabitans sp.]|nr:DUF3291 domain-containing protein [Candidatus Synoicihabitans sp.]
MVSITRLRLRSARFLPGFAWHTWLSTRQVRRSPGFLGGYLAGGPGLAFWTVTVWTDQEAMRAFRSAGAHLSAMRKLIDWCDEAAVTHWDQPLTESPSAETASARLRGEGRLSKVRHPSPAHAAGQTWPDGKVPRPARALVP